MFEDKLNRIQAACAAGAADTAQAVADSDAADYGTFSPPLSNRGGTKNAEAVGHFQESFECYERYLLDAKGNIVAVPLRRGVSDFAFIDQISFSFHEQTFFDKYGTRVSLLEDEDFVRAASMLAQEIFGFGIYQESKGSGGRFYERCWLMGSENVLYGRVHFGGQNQTMLVELTGTGCNAAKAGWEARLFDFLSMATRPKITRVDIAKDFFNGEYSPEQARVDRNAGLFTCHNRKPKGECIGSDWEEDDVKNMFNGKTYGVGSRESSKYVRVYEKGKQLGDKQSSWTRFEIEFKSKDIIIPLEVLTNPGEYFGGAYPVCERFSHQASRIQTVKESKQITAANYVEWVKKQFGRAANGLKQVFPELSKAELFELIEPEHHKLPKSLAPDAYDCAFAQVVWLHQEPKTEKQDEFGMMALYNSIINKERELDEDFDNAWMYDKYAYCF